LEFRGKGLQNLADHRFLLLAGVLSEADVFRNASRIILGGQAIEGTAHCAKRLR
jgi:hypothetical protein